jgi:SNF2 family DNA or RNA helicase
MCRTPIDTSKVIYVGNDARDGNKTIEEKKLSKYECFEKLLKEKLHTGRKILIFSEYDETFTTVKKILNKYNMNYKQLLGTSNTIQATVTEYKKSCGTLSTLLLNARHYGSGLNLENTSDIVIFHQMNSDLEKQVIGRSQRMGRTAPLNIYKLLNQNETS